MDTGAGGCHCGVLLYQSVPGPSPAQQPVGTSTGTPQADRQLGRGHSPTHQKAGCLKTPRAHSSPRTWLCPPEGPVPDPVHQWAGTPGALGLSSAHQWTYTGSWTPSPARGDPRTQRRPPAGGPQPALLSRGQVPAQDHHSPTACCIRTQPAHQQVDTRPRTPLCPGPAHQQANTSSKTPWTPQLAALAPLPSRLTPVWEGHPRPCSQPCQEQAPSTSGLMLAPGQPGPAATHPGSQLCPPVGQN